MRVESRRRGGPAAAPPPPVERPPYVSQVAVVDDEFGGLAIEARRRSAQLQTKRRQAELRAQLFVIALGVAAIGGAIYYASTIKAPPKVGQEIGPPPGPAPPDDDQGDKPIAERHVPLLPPVPPPEEPPSPESPVKPKVEEEHPPEIVLIDLDLKDRRTRKPLEVPPSKAIKVAGIKHCLSQAKVMPPSGRLAEGNPVQIAIAGVRDVTLNLTLDHDGEERPVLLVEGSITTDSGDEVPLSLTNVHRIVRKVQKNYESAVAYHDAMTADKLQLEGWLRSPGVKPLAEVGNARRRMEEISASSPEQTRLVEALRAENETAERVLELVQHLHQDCAIELEIAEP